MTALVAYVDELMQENDCTDDDREQFIVDLMTRWNWTPELGEWYGRDDGGRVIYFVRAS